MAFRSIMSNQGVHLPRKPGKMGKRHVCARPGRLLRNRRSLAAGRTVLALEEVSMRYVYAVVLLVFAAGLPGCDAAKVPTHAIPGSTETQADSTTITTAWPRPPRPRSAKRVYQGRTVDEWAEALQAKEQGEIWQAARALHVMGAEGRPHLWQGLQSPSVHTRRICLDNLTVADLRCYGDDGRRQLVTLAGDVEDCRIRERASYYLAQWKYYIPAP
jgi:hypothetical protein